MKSANCNWSLSLRKKERIGSKAKKEMITILIKESYPLTGQPYPKRLIFKVVAYSSSTWYENPTPKTGRRGRKPRHTDEDVLQGIKAEIKNSKFNAEGYI